MLSKINKKKQTHPNSCFSLQLKQLLMKSYQAPASPFDWNANEAVDPEVFRKWWDETQNEKTQDT